MRRRTRDILALLVMAALVLLLDQASKHLVAERLAEGRSWDAAPWLASLFHITHVTNTGAAFGLFPNASNFFIAVAVVVIAVLVLYYLRLPDGQWLVRIALALQLGGALGNLIDRLRQGYVVDFIDLNFWPLHNWPVFNLADSSVVVGVTLLTLVMIREERREQRRQQQSTQGKAQAIEDV